MKPAARRPSRWWLLAAGVAACSGNRPDPDQALEQLAITAVAPAVAVPGTTLVVEGRSFVDEPWGRSYLQLDGTLDGVPVEDVLLPASFTDFDHLELIVGNDTMAALGADHGHFEGIAAVVVDSLVDHHRYRSEPLDLDLTFATTLTPEVASAELPAIVFVNSTIEVTGSGFLLGGTEGDTVAVIRGTFQPDGGDPRSIGPVEVPLAPGSAFDRSTGTVALVPELTGIRAGQFTGTLHLENRHAGGDVVSATDSSDLASKLSFDLTETTVFGASPTEVSLGQYMVIEGGGFVGDGATTIRLDGSFTPDGGDSVPLDAPIELVPEYVDGATLRYVVSEDDLPLDLRRDVGTFEGELVPVVGYEGDELEGSSGTFSIRIAPVKQVVYLHFDDNFVETLRDFGLRAAQDRIRDRVVEVIERDYATINLEVRTEPPDDFAMYAEVDVSGRDPQDLGLLGYDNTPGKDVDNLRLYDRLGGVNAQTQQDGYPGYGGVFVESLFAFSRHPVRGVDEAAGSDPLFDAIFDEFRPDRGGQPVRAADLQGVSELDASGATCPAQDRHGRVGCAIWVLGNMIGTTLSHEIGHSLGLANPYGSGFHNPYDEPNRLMDAGSARPFTERAELVGDGPGRFCDEAYEYLRAILPTSEPPDQTPRPTCY